MIFNCVWFRGIFDLRKKRDAITQWHHVRNCSASITRKELFPDYLQRAGLRDWRTNRTSSACINGGGGRDRKSLYREKVKWKNWPAYRLSRWRHGCAPNPRGNVPNSCRPERELPGDNPQPGREGIPDFRSAVPANNQSIVGKTLNTHSRNSSLRAHKDREGELTRPWRSRERM